MIEKKQLQTIFFEFKLSDKAVKTTHNTKSAVSQRTANERRMRRWFQKFRNGDGSLEDEEYRGCSLEVDNDELKALFEADNDSRVCCKNRRKSSKSFRPPEAIWKIKEAL